MKMFAIIVIAFSLLGQSYAGEPISGDQGLYEMKIPEELQRMSREERLADAVAYYTKQGFFKGQEQGLYHRADHKLAEDWGAGNDPFESLDPSGYHDYADLYLLALDEQRVWWKDLEADVGQGNNVYADAIREWGDISNGAFAPTKIVEKWQSDEGPAEIEFELKGMKYSISAEYYNDFMDIDILDQLNSIIKQTGYQFVFIVIDQMAFVTCLTEEQKRQWEADRGLRFFNNG